MKTIVRLSIMLVLLVALVPVSAFARHGNSRTIYGGYGARGYGPGGYTISGASASTQYGSESGSEADMVDGSSAYSVSGDCAYSVPQKKRCVSQEEPVLYTPPPEADSDYYVLGGPVYK